MRLATTKNRRRVLIPGPVLIGFSALFDRSYGDPRTARPYPKVIPSQIGGVLLPFACPHCSEVRAHVIDQKTRLGYHDKDRDFSWCPACQGRYVICPKGAPLKGTLPVGATHAPALVERGTKREIVGLPTADGLNVLGAD